MILCQVSGFFANADGTPYVGTVQVIPTDDIISRDDVVITKEPLVFRLGATNGSFNHLFSPGTYTVVFGTETWTMIVPEVTQVDLASILIQQ